MAWLLAGLGPELIKYVGGTGLVVLLLAGAYFVPVGKRFFIEAAVIVAVALAVYTMGVRNEAARCKAQQAVVKRHVTAAVTYAHSKKALHARDPYDSSRN
jgi:hypothetical protein